MKTIGDLGLLQKHAGYGALLAHLRNLPEMAELYSEHCFKHGSRGRGNGQVATSPLAGSNIWLADKSECVLIYQAEKGRGPLVMHVYVRSQDSQVLSQKVWSILAKYGLPLEEFDLPPS